MTSTDSICSNPLGSTNETVDAFFTPTNLKRTLTKQFEVYEQLIAGLYEQYVAIIQDHDNVTPARKLFTKQNDTRFLYSLFLQGKQENYVLGFYADVNQDVRLQSGICALNLFYDEPSTLSASYVIDEPLPAHLKRLIQLLAVMNPQLNYYRFSRKSLRDCEQFFLISNYLLDYQIKTRMTPGLTVIVGYELLNGAPT
jgi:hypothetical protein